jgi:hypothetical protein
MFTLPKQTLAHFISWLRMFRPNTLPNGGAVLCSRLERFKKCCSHSGGERKKRSFWVLASFRLSCRPLRACVFAEASPKPKNPRSERLQNFLKRSSDAEILSACHTERRIFVTYDMATVPDLLRQWMAEDRSHSGVIFADENTIKPNSPAEMATAIAALEREIDNADTTNLVRYLRPSR